MRLPDPSRSRALLLGASLFSDPELPDLPAVRNNLTDLAEILAGPAGTALPAGHCVALADESDRGVIGQRLNTVATEAEDMLLVYYAGHGLVGRDGALYLSLPNTRGDPDMVSWTALPFDLLRNTLAKARADNRVLILDCCFSGTAIDLMTDVTTAVSGQLTVAGTCTLASSPANRPSKAPTGARYTAYTGELLGLLRNGIEATGVDLLTLDVIHEHLEKTLPTKGFPRPERRSTRNIGHLALARNRHGSPPDLMDTAYALDEEQLYRRAAAQGDISAMNSLGWLLQNRGDVTEAVEWYRRAIDRGNTAAMNNLGLLHQERGEFHEAETLYRQAAALGDALGMNNLGWQFERRGDLTQAEDLYRRAVAQDNAPAMNNLGWLLDRRGELTQAEDLYRRAVAQSNAPAMNNLGWLLDRRGEYIEAEQWYRRAAAQDNALAMCNLGWLLDRRGELIQAEQWYRQAIAKNNAQAMHNLGSLLERRGEPTQAIQWYRQAIATGHAPAVHNLASLLRRRT